MKNKGSHAFFFICIFAFCAFIVQTIWLPRLTILGAAPDLLLILVCLTGIFKGPYWGSCTGGVLGFLLGLLNNHLILSFLIWLLLGLFCGSLKSNLFSNLKLLSALSCLAGTWLIYFLYWTLSAIFLKEPFYTPWETPLLNSFINSVIAFLLFPLFKNGFILDKNG